MKLSLPWNSAEDRKTLQRGQSPRPGSFRERETAVQRLSTLFKRLNRRYFSKQSGLMNWANFCSFCAGVTAITALSCALTASIDGMIGAVFFAACTLYLRREAKKASEEIVDHLEIGRLIIKDLTGECVKLRGFNNQLFYNLLLEKAARAGEAAGDADMPAADIIPFNGRTN